jgi:hypothetical protein
MNAALALLDEDAPAKPGESGRTAAA